MSPQPYLRRVALIIAVPALLIAGCKDGGTASSGNTGSGEGESPPGAASSDEGRGENSADGGQGPRGASSGGPAGPALSRCHTSQLRGRVVALEPAAGNRYAALVLTNDEDRPCRTFGWTGLQLAAPGGESLPTRVERTGAARKVVLGAGESAWSRLHWTAVPGAGEPDTAACRPNPSALLVIPPDETTQLTTTWRYGPACNGGRISATPLAPGTGPGSR